MYLDDNKTGIDFNSLYSNLLNAFIIKEVVLYY